ncbi:thiolase family protein [Mycobacterium sp. CVI_P3]|uniref:Thiolase family protein n=2 Tax=Mycobacterium pinniadriaticum TaxID=2994102 RepID=A0ABT3SA38_9MYCO|nr:thiolase family protein [Mycobacterium pinniadriaticum]MCX2929968.1 thiolase family protein [Mycobacterium pinniadriaticum]MCX2936383.1 thiolase family protein [Mycobacterium pinniadriaticum]
MDTVIVGLGITPFGRHDDTTGVQLGELAARAALLDAGVTWADIEFACGGSMSAGSADTLVANLGLTGVPFQHIFNGCATGGSALVSANAMLASGQAELALVVGFDNHDQGAFDLDPATWGLDQWYGDAGLMVAPQYFAMKARRYMHDFGISPSSLAKVPVKATANGLLNDNAWRRTPLTEEQVLTSSMVADPLTKLMFCSPGAGAVALVLATSRRAKAMSQKPIRLRSVAFRTRPFGSFDVFSPAVPVELSSTATADAAVAAFEAAGIGPMEVDIVQVQDTDSGAELIHLAETGLCDHGEQERLIQRGLLDIGGPLPVNTDGGCIANGEPVGASGLRQIHEIALQLRGGAGRRQVPTTPTVGFTHVYGAPGVSACAVLTT